MKFQDKTIKIVKVIPEDALDVCNGCFFHKTYCSNNEKYPDTGEHPDFTKFIEDNFDGDCTLSFNERFAVDDGTDNYIN